MLPLHADPGGGASRGVRGRTSAAGAGGRDGVLAGVAAVATGRLRAAPAPGRSSRPADGHLPGGRDAVRGRDELPGGAGGPGGDGRGKRPAADGRPAESRAGGTAAAGQGAARLGLSVALRDPGWSADGTRAARPGFGGGPPADPTPPPAPRGQPPPQARAAISPA